MQVKRTICIAGELMSSESENGSDPSFMINEYEKKKSAQYARNQETTKCIFLIEANTFWRGVW